MNIMSSYGWYEKSLLQSHNYILTCTFYYIELLQIDFGWLVTLVDWGPTKYFIFIVNQSFRNETKRVLFEMKNSCQFFFHFLYFNRDPEVFFQSVFKGNRKVLIQSMLFLLCYVLVRATQYIPMYIQNSVVSQQSEQLAGKAFKQ